VLIGKLMQNYQEAIAIGRTFAGLKDYQIDGNKEMVALGTMNIVGSMTSCYVATGNNKFRRRRRKIKS
jgi:MFS superfamily sulfate permease-like transporter